jgi:dipeptidase
MYIKPIIGFCFLLSLLLTVQTAQADCTTLIVTKGASSDGSVFVAHSEDAHLMDSAIVYVPARDWPAGSRRPVYPSAVAVEPLPQYNAYLVPRLTAKERAPGYDHPEAPATAALGFIPQAERTYAYLDGNYGIVNEYGLMFGECTNGAFITNLPEAGRRIFYASELSRVALERCKTAREAILLMGRMIDDYGYYGTGETLPVADADEAWVMEMAPSPTGQGGLWVAQKVPDGHVFVAANEFRIREIDPENPDQIIGRTVFNDIENAGWRFPADKGQKLDWLRSVSHGEYSHPYYSLRRVWRAMSMVAPSAGLPAWVEDGTTRAYPFSIVPDHKLTLDDIKRIYRDHYEGTEFDLTKGAAAGPFANPTRYLGPDDPSGDVGNPNVKLSGAWERPIGVFYTLYTTINQSKPGVPYPMNVVCWIGLNTAAETAFLPLAVAPLPASYEKGDTRIFDRESAWRIYNLVGEYANIKYSYMIKDIQNLAAELEKNSQTVLDNLYLELAARAKTNPRAALKRFAQTLNDNAEQARRQWLKLFQNLVVKYAQGYINTPAAMAQRIGYPAGWLKNTDYYSGPTSYQKRAPK